MNISNELRKIGWFPGRKSELSWYSDRKIELGWYSDVKIQFDDEKVAWYEYADLEQIEHSYAITIHKAQRK